jgi:RimJ/RimL family protein N-acetyltransferase
MSRANHIVFRGFQSSDADALISWASSPDELLQWSGPHFSFPLDRKQLRAYAKSAGERRQLISGVLAGTDAVVAHAELNLLPEHELGQIRRVIVAPELRGRGIGRELIQWLVKLSFVDLHLNRLELVVFDFNEPARRCYEAAGFKEEGRAKQARRASGNYWDLIYMALLRGWYDQPGELAMRNGSGGLYVRK